MVRLLFLLILFISLNTSARAQTKWSISHSHQKLTDLANQLEKSGYIVKKIALSNNEFLDDIRLNISSSDTTYIIALTFSPLTNTSILNPKDISLNLYGKIFNRRLSRETDTLLIEQKGYENLDDDKNKTNIFGWKMFIGPSQLSAYQSKSILSYRVSLDELTRIGTINQEVSPVGDTPEKRSKRSDHKQLALIVFSRS